MEQAMLMRVRESGDNILIELTGIAGRQQSVLRALSACREQTADDPALATAEVSVRSSSNDMRIRLRPQPGLRVEPTTIYRCLRPALMGEAPGQAAAAVNAAVAVAAAV
jgi:hypothetical protein